VFDLKAARTEQKSFFAPANGNPFKFSPVPAAVDSTVCSYFQLPQVVDKAAFLKARNSNLDS